MLTLICNLVGKSKNAYFKIMAFCVCDYILLSVNIYT